MTAFRDEIKATREHDSRVAKFVPSSKFANSAPDTQLQIEQRADEIFGPSPVGPGLTGENVDDDEDDFAEWPDELLLLGINMDEAEAGSTTSTTTTTTTTDDDTNETDDTDDEDEDAWPLEMLID